MPQPIQIETQAEQQGLPHLHRQTAARGAGRELAFDRREDALDQRAAPVELLGKARRISARTPCTRQVFFPRLAGITLCAPSC